MGVEASPPVQLETAGLDFAILGGGILGTAVAALAAAAGRGVVVFRQHDRRIPRADTLRNQGWLQSGIAYPIRNFASERDFMVTARSAYYAGRRLLRECGVGTPAPGAVLRASKKDRIDEVERKLQLLRYPQDEFRRLDSDEARGRVRGLYDPASAYFQLPDAPFDVAHVVQHLRDIAMRNGAQFIQLEQPASMVRNGGSVAISLGGALLESPLTLLVAGAGSLPLMKQIGHTSSIVLRQTPLLVHEGCCGIEVPIMVDLDLGFAAVRHEQAGGGEAIVVGTKVRRELAGFVGPDDRRVSQDDIERFVRCLPSSISVSTGRFTAGCEVIPQSPLTATEFDPFVQDFGNVLFASPGRATTGLSAAEMVLAELERKLQKQGRRPFRYDGGALEGWSGDVGMHFRPNYNFNDAET